MLGMDIPMQTELIWARRKLAALLMRLVALAQAGIEL
jgi:hypothetical protein